MTNEMIIFREKCRLMECGIIGTTGRTVELRDENGEIKKYLEPEEIHTYAAWRSLGYQVKRGEHAVTQLKIWKHTTRKRKAEEEKQEQTEEKMIATNAYFFATSQVEKMGGKDNEG